MITVMEAMVGGSEDGLVDNRLVDCVMEDGLVDGMVDDWCRLGHWDDTAAHLTGELHRDLPARVSSELAFPPNSRVVSMAMRLMKSFFNTKMFPFKVSKYFQLQENEMTIQPAFGGAELGRAFLKCGRVEVGRGELETTLFLQFNLFYFPEHANFLVLKLSASTVSNSLRIRLF